MVTNEGVCGLKKCCFGIYSFCRRWLKHSFIYLFKFFEIEFLPLYVSAARCQVGLDDFVEMTKKYAQGVAPSPVMAAAGGDDDDDDDVVVKNPDELPLHQKVGSSQILWGCVCCPLDTTLSSFYPLFVYTLKNVFSYCDFIITLL